jgi:hypothetical protein
MSDGSNGDLGGWTADWRAGEAPDGELPGVVLRRVRSGRWRQAAYTVFEALVATGVLALVIVQAVRMPVAWNVGAMAALALLIVASMAFSIWNRSGTWRPAAESTRAFLDLVALRLERRLRALRAGLWLVAVEGAVLAPWVALAQAARAERTGVPVSAGDYAVAFAMLGAWLGLVAAGCLWLIRRTRRQLGEIEAVRGDLGEADRGPEEPLPG